MSQSGNHGKPLGDIHQRIIHGITIVNAFTSILNPYVNLECPFCTDRETVFHAFMNCFRLETVFKLLTDLFYCFNKLFSLKTFICAGKAYLLMTKEQKRELEIIVLKCCTSPCIFFTTVCHF